jgi:hypothetical protein
VGQRPLGTALPIWDPGVYCVVDLVWLYGAFPGII